MFTTKWIFVVDIKHIGEDTKQNNNNSIADSNCANAQTCALQPTATYLSLRSPKKRCSRTFSASNKTVVFSLQLKKINSPVDRSNKTDSPVDVASNKTNSPASRTPRVKRCARARVNQGESTFAQHNNQGSFQ